LEKLNERDTFENTGMKERVIFKLMIKKYDESNGMFIWSRTITRVFCCEHVLEFLSSIRCKKFIL
jgi:hypothetical protein